MSLSKDVPLKSEMLKSVPLGPPKSVMLKSVRFRSEREKLAEVKFVSSERPVAAVAAELNWMTLGGTPLGYSAWTASCRAEGGALREGSAFQ